MSPLLTVAIVSLVFSAAWKRGEQAYSNCASVALEQPAHRLIIGVAGGVRKAEAILAALHGKLQRFPLLCNTVFLLAPLLA
ncbi:hypothetical protein [Nostoc sp.]|uniref:hypothetical protein n=1 Tax=Nostoc sp. TaxID=1180 RepID=UPI002FFBA8CE